MNIKITLDGFKSKGSPMEFSKKMLIAHGILTVLLVFATILVSIYTDRDVTALATLAGASFAVDGTYGGFYLWKSKNENRAKYAQKFVKMFANEYGIENAIKVAELVLKD